MDDLRLRGAGNIVGVEQSGHVASIGFHLYCKLLRRTIDSLQGKTPSWTLETRVEAAFDARLPEYYVNDVNLRMEIYQRLGDAISLEEVDKIWEEVRDRFGRPPEAASWLYRMSRVRVFASQRGYTHIKLDNFTLSYERKQGNVVSTNKVLISKIKSPEDMEEKICKILAKE
jgi:transcription-repair coupling factor (superfamily II helicase)